MKKIFVICLLFILMLSNKNVYAEENNSISNEEILNQQQKELGISEFIKSSKKYIDNNLEGININEIFSSAITGRIGNTNLWNNILNLLGREFKSTISMIRHSINYCNYT